MIVFKTTICFILILPFFANGATKRSYENFKVYTSVTRTKEHVDFFNDLKKTNNILDYYFWESASHVGSTVKIMVSPRKHEEFIELIKELGLDIELIFSNVQQLIDDQLNPSMKKTNSRTNINTRSTLGSMSWDRFHPLDSIYNWLEEIEQLYPSVVTVYDIGKSIEGRDIKFVKINYRPNDRGDSPLIAVIEAGIHAAEWIGPATATWIIKELLTSEDPAVRELAERFEWHIIPVMNPDGYVYTFSNDRFWRKNRNQTNYMECPDGDHDMSNGIDLNRNFDFRWMRVWLDSPIIGLFLDEGTSTDPCDVFFGGLGPFSEPETRAVADYILQLKDQGEMIYYISFHSYSQFFLLPHGHLTGVARLEIGNFGDLYEISIRSADKAKERYGTEYVVGTPPELLYAVSGTSFDWVKDLGVPLSLAMELRDDGFYGFLLPAEQIIPNNEEYMDILLETDNVARLLGYY